MLGILGKQSYIYYVNEKRQDMIEWFLKLDESQKLQFIEDLFNEGNEMEALALVKIVLDAPLNQGGIQTEKIKKVINERI